MQSSRWVLPLVLAPVLMAANALKPPVIDDTAYLALARQMAIHPLDPYGFEQFWYQEPEPANHVLAPPVLPSWIALGIRLLGEQPPLLKLWLFPFALLFTFALQTLLRRFARPMESPMLVLAVVSPAVLPAFNFFLDLPSLAFSLAAMTVFFRGLDKRSWTMAVFAGVLAGLAMQTKYVGFLTPPLLIVAGISRRRYLPGFIAAGVAMSIFAAWEAFIAWKYGESHFLYQLGQQSTTWRQKLLLLAFLVTLLGGLAPGIALAAIARWRWWLVVSTVGLAAVHLCFARFGPDYTLIYSILGGTTILTFAAAFGLGTITRKTRIHFSRRTAFLFVWIAAEVAGYLMMTPFPASRRVIGLTLALTILAGRIAATTCRTRRINVWLAVIPGVLLGVYFAAVDFAEARIEPEGVSDSAEYIRGQDASPTIWFVGHWGFQYAAEREGMKPLAAGRSILRKGDWLVVPDKEPPSRQNQQEFHPDPRMGLVLHTVVIRNRFPRTTRPWYYGGEWPMVNAGDVRLEVRIYRIQDTWAPR